MLTNSPDCSTCLFSWYGLLITVGGVGGVGGDFSQTRMTLIGRGDKPRDRCHSADYHTKLAVR